MGKADTISLHTPARHPLDPQQLDARPKAVEKWLQQLPRANTGECARMYFKFLRELNRVEIADADRFRILELCREPGEFIYQALSKHYLGLAFPLPEKKQHIALLARELECEMAVGYKIIINNRLSGKAGKIDKHTFHLTLLRCCEHLGRVLLRSYLVYTPPPAAIWEELHGLYRYAEQQKLHLGELRAAGSNIEQHYLRSVLLHLTNPARLRQADIIKIHELLLEWTAKARLTPYGSTPAEGVVVVDLASATPPDLNAMPEGADNQWLRLLELTPMLQYISEHAGTYTRSFGAKDALQQLKLLAPHTLHQLLFTWSGGAKRHFTRSHTQGNVDLAIGLRAAHHFLLEAEQRREPVENATNRPFRPTDSGMFEIKSRFKSGAAVPHNIDIWNPSYTIAAHEADYNIDFDSQTIEGSLIDRGAEPDAHYEIHACVSVDESATGYRLVWIPWEGKKPPLNIQVGELVVIRGGDAKQNLPWSVGLIRWIKNTTREKVELGVEKLAPYAMAAGIRSKVKGKEAGDVQRALLLPRIKAIDQAETLLLPALIDASRTLKLYYHGKTVPIKLTAMVDSTGAIAQYEFEETHRDKVTARQDDNDNGQLEQEFDGVWKTL